MIGLHQRWFGGFVVAVVVLPSLARAQGMTRSSVGRVEVGEH